jgi:hypothetical protein
MTATIERLKEQIADYKTASNFFAESIRLCTKINRFGYEADNLIDEVKRRETAYHAAPKFGKKHRQAAKAYLLDTKSLIKEAKCLLQASRILLAVAESCSKTAYVFYEAAQKEE